jgi:hypothetical protein
MTLITINDENAQAVIVKTSFLVLGLLCIAGFFVVSARFAASALAGGILVLLNHCWLRSIMERILAGQAENAARYAIIRYLLRLSLIAVAVVALFRLNVDIMGLFAGLSILVVATIAVSLYSLVHHKGESS